MLSKTINLAIVDDHALFRKTLGAFLPKQENIQVVFQASDIFDLMTQLKESPIDVLILKMFLPEFNGNDALKMIHSEYPCIRILVLLVNIDFNLISELPEAGIHGYISNADDPDDLIQAIHAAADDRIYRNKIFTDILYWNKQKSVRNYIVNSNPHLSEREKKILQLIWEEKSNKEISVELFLGVRSVEKIRQDMKEKIGVKSTVGLLKYAINRQIIHLNTLKNGMVRQS
jgi:DNA-binding NarL/FixJ family response regulator